MILQPRYIETGNSGYNMRMIFESLSFVGMNKFIATGKRIFLLMFILMIKPLSSSKKADYEVVYVIQTMRKTS